MVPTPSKMSDLDEFDSCLRMANVSDVRGMTTECHLPTMADTARQVSCAPATNTSSERVFSECGTV